MNDYDMACRRLVKSEPAAFLTWLLTDFAQTCEQVGWVDTRRIAFPGKADQTGDLVAELRMLRVVQALWALALEFQSEPDPRMFGRMLVYLGTLWDEQRPDALPGSHYQLASTVINLTGTSASLPASASFVWPGSDAMECTLRVRERYLAEESAELTLEGIASGRYDRMMLPWVVLMSGGSTPEALRCWLELATAETDARRRAEIGYAARVFAEKSADPEGWRTILEGWDVVRSQVMEQTRAEGRVEDRQESLLELLIPRSQGSIPTELAGAIRACTDLAKLRSWFTIAVATTTLEQFREQAGL